MLHLMATLSLLAQAPASPAPDLSWMAGYWLDCSDGREASEVWSGPREGLMVGHALSTRNGRSGFEFSHIRPQADGVLAYVAQPSGTAPTVFRLLRHDAQSIVFSNPENDFPHRIIYQRRADQLLARIEGADDDENRSMEWTFNKAELNSRCPR